jgi:uncharacterized protein YbjT (DUF2867 family)
MIMSKENQTILLVGGTGRLGALILSELRKKGYSVRLLVRPGRPAPEGVERVEGELGDARSLEAAADGAAAVISAVNGGSDVVVVGQLNLLAAARRQGVRRFIPSDYSLDYFHLDYGDNIFLDDRKRIAAAIEDSGVDHTFVLSGGFMEIMLERGGIDFAGGRINHWGSGDEPVDVTAISDVARLVAAVVLDPHARNRRVQFAGDVVSARSIAREYQQLGGQALALHRIGSVDDLQRWIAETKAKARSPLDYVFGQYAWAQLSGKGKLRELENDRYPEIQPIKMRELLRTIVSKSPRS